MIKRKLLVYTVEWQNFAGLVWRKNLQSKHNMKGCGESLRLILLAALFVIFCAAQFFGYQFTYSVEHEEYHMILQVDVA